MLRSRFFWGVMAVVLVLGFAGLAQAAMILAPTDPIYGVAAAPGDALSILPITPQNNYPIAEAPAKAIDGIVAGSKYLNFGKTNVGFIVVPAFGPSKLTSVRMASANDHNERDPMTITIEGTNGPFGTYLGVFDTTWTPIYSGSSGLDTDPGRNQWGVEMAVAGTEFFSYYRVLITTLRDATTANSFQFSEIELNGIPVPEPASMLCFGFALPLLLVRRRRV